LYFNNLNRYTAITSLDVPPNHLKLERMVRERVRELDLTGGFQAWKQFPEFNCLASYTFPQVQNHHFSEEELPLLPPSVCSEYLGKYNSDTFKRFIENALHERATRNDIFLAHNALIVFKARKRYSADTHLRGPLCDLLRQKDYVTYFRRNNYPDFAQEIEVFLNS